MSEDISVSAAQRQDRLSLGKAVPDISGMKDRQRSKIEQLRRALAADGILTLDVQAKVLTLSRSTTWSILRATHKTSGLSAGVIARMLGSPLLPAVARRIILEYVQEKLAGLYGHSERRRREFSANLSIAGLTNVDAAGRNNIADTNEAKQDSLAKLAAMAVPRRG